MYIHPQLQNFAQDDAWQQRALSDVHQAMQHWKNGEIGQKQSQYILKAGDASTPENCIKHLKPLFDDLSWLYAMIEQICTVQRCNPFANIELRSNKNDAMQTIILHQARKFSITLGFVKPQKQSQAAHDNFIFGPDMMMLSAIDSAHIIKAQLDERDNLLKPKMLISNDGELHIYDNRRQSVNFIAKERPIIFLRATIKTNAFDASPQKLSHHYWHYIGDSKPTKQLADTALPRAQFIFSILRHQICRKAIPLFEQWVRHDTPDMRWYVMREFLALDMQAALPHLKFMAHYDDDRAVRKTALSTWSILQSQYPEAFQE